MQNSSAEKIERTQTPEVKARGESCMTKYRDDEATLDSGL